MLYTCVKCEYDKYSKEAHDPCLKALFQNIKSTETEHLATISRIMQGEEVKAGGCVCAVNESLECQASSCTEDEKRMDAYLCKDALAMEKHVSSVYDTSRFEFVSPTLRDTLNHIQKEEQIHGEQLYQYMAKNNMYC